MRGLEIDTRSGTIVFSGHPEDAGRTVTIVARQDHEGTTWNPLCYSDVVELRDWLNECLDEEEEYRRR